jgi:hypothetical protein
VAAYSFKNIVAGLVGPTGVINLGNGSGNAEEGITVAPTEDKNTMVVGADGTVQHTLIASSAGVVTLRYLKTSPTNGFLQLMYDAQTQSSALWGQNVITVVDTARLEITTAQACAFKKKPEIVYDKAGPMLEWTFDSGAINSVLGVL